MEKLNWNREHSTAQPMHATQTGEDINSGYSPPESSPRGSSPRGSSPREPASSGVQDTGLAGRAGHLLAQCAQWLKGARLRERQAPRLALVERIALAPRQTLALVEAEGRRLLVAIPADGSPAFLALDSQQPSRRPNAASASKLPAARTSKPANSSTRVSW